MLRAYDEMIAAADAVDRAAAYEDLMRAHNGLSDVIWVYLQAGDTGSAMVLQKQQEQLKEQLDAYKPEHYAKAYADLVLPVRALSNQLIRGRSATSWTRSSDRMKSGRRSCKFCWDSRPRES